MRPVDHISSVAAVVAAISWPGSALGPNLRQVAHEHAVRQPESLVVLRQVPQRAEWEITFAQVEAAAGWPDLRTAPANTFEARLMDRAGPSFAPVPFLRIVRTDGTVRAQLAVFWGRNVSPSHQPQGHDVRCRDGVCVKPIDLVEQRDWEKVAGNLARQSNCPGKNPLNTVRSPDGGLSSMVTVCPHCPTIYIKTFVDGKYREQVCDDPLPQTEAGALRALMMVSTQATGR